MIETVFKKVLVLLAGIRETKEKMPAGFYLVLFWVMCGAVIVWYMYRRYAI